MGVEWSSLRWLELRSVLSAFYIVPSLYYLLAPIVGSAVFAVECVLLTIIGIVACWRVKPLDVHTTLKYCLKGCMIVSGCVIFGWCLQYIKAMLVL